MKKKNYIIIRNLFLVLSLSMISLATFAQKFYHIYSKDEGIVQVAGNATDSVKVRNGSLVFYNNNTVSYLKKTNMVDSIRIAPEKLLPLLDVVFDENGIAKDISTYNRSISTVESTSLCTFYSNRFQNYVARFSNSSPGEAIDNGYYKFNYNGNTAFMNALADGHSLEAVIMSNIAPPFPDKEIKPFSSHEGGGTGLMIGNNSRNNSIIFLPHIGSAGYAWANSGVTPQQGKYYHVVGVWSKVENKAYIYIDGVLKNTVTTSGNFNFPNATGNYWFGIGVDAGPSPQAAWKGDIAVARIYDQALNAAEVESLWNKYKNLEPENIDISNISFPSGASVVRNGNYVIQGIGYAAGDKIKITPMTGGEGILCNGVVAPTSLTITVPEALVTGKYRLLLVRGDKTLDLGFTTLIVEDFASESPQVIAHRGYWDVAGSAQNSITSLRKAQELGVYGSEFDVWITPDNVLVINHDGVIDGRSVENTNYYGNLENLKLGNGESVPTLQAYLAQGLLDTNTKLILEIKTHSTQANNNRVVAAVVAMVAEKGMADQINYIAFSIDVCKKILELQPGARVGYLEGDYLPTNLHQLGIKSMAYSIGVLRSHLSWISEAHSLGMTVNVWTVNGDADILEMKNIGVDFITTDKPVVAKQLLGR